MPSGIYIRTKSIWNKGKTLSKKCRKKISLALKGRVSPMKGKHHSKETCKKISLGLKGKTKGKIFSKKHKKKLSLTHLGKSGYWKDKQRSKATCKKISLGNKGKLKGYKHSKKAKKNMSLAQKKLWRDPKHRKKIFAHKIPSYFESKIIYLIEKYNIPYKFVGNGKVWIGGKNPDFIHTNNKKIVIEVYGTRHKKWTCKHSNYEKVRKKHFKKYNYKVIFLNEKDLFEENWEQCCLTKINRIQ